MLDPDTILQHRYKIIRPIGKGGMGAVYLAVDQRLGNTVALKESFFAEEFLRKAFEREARLLAGLRHTAMTRVSDHFTEGDGQFLVMEFIRGDDMAELLAQRGGAFAPAEVLAGADQLLDALDYLHTQEPPIIHRDIKPQNLKLTGRNQIILLDFGLAKGEAAGMTRVSSVGSVFGYTASYASLEQIQGAGTDPRSDLYSLAATLYHLMTNAVPVDALTRATATVNGDPDPLCPAHALNPAITPQVSAVLSQALALKRNDRPTSAAEMRQLLRAAQAAPPPNSGRLPANALPSTVMIQPEALAAQLANAHEAAQAQAANSEATAPQPAPTAPNVKTTQPSQPTTPPVVNVTPTPSAPQVATPQQPTRKSRKGVWLAVVGVGLVISIGLVLFVAIAIISAQQQTTDSGSANTTPVVNNNQSTETNSNTASEQNSNTNSKSEKDDADTSANTYNSNSTANSNTDSTEEYTPTNSSDVHVENLYMTDSPDGSATTSFNPGDHTVYAIIQLNKVAVGTQVRFSWIAVDVAGEERGSKIKDIDYTTGAMENIVRAHLTLPQDWPAGQYKVEVYLNGNLEQTIEYTVE